MHKTLLTLICLVSTLVLTGCDDTNIEQYKQHVEMQDLTIMEQAQEVTRLNKALSDQHGVRMADIEDLNNRVDKYLACKKVFNLCSQNIIDAGEEALAYGYAGTANSFEVFTLLAKLVIGLTVVFFVALFGYRWKVKPLRAEIRSFSSRRDQILNECESTRKRIIELNEVGKIMNIQNREIWSKLAHTRKKWEAERRDDTDWSDYSCPVTARSIKQLFVREPGYKAKSAAQALPEETSPNEPDVVLTPDDVVRVPDVEKQNHYKDILGNK